MGNFQTDLPITEEFFLRTDPVLIAKQLIGCQIYSRIGGELTGGRIVETEAYKAPGDRASHAYGNKRTPRTETMFARGGCSYIYLCYGIHHLFNIVTGPTETPHAVLLRAIQPLEGIPVMRERRKHPNELNLANGPGKLSEALGITRDYNESPLTNPKGAIWLCGPGETQHPQVVTSHRIGINYAGEDALLPWRFLEKNSPYISAQP